MKNKVIDLINIDRTGMHDIQRIAIDDNLNVDITYASETKEMYNTTITTDKQFSYSAVDDAVVLDLVGQLVNYIRKKQATHIPENTSCPPGCAACCQDYRPAVTREDMLRIANRFALTLDQVVKQFVNTKEAFDGSSIGWLKKQGPEDDASCVFLQGKKSGEYRCGIYTDRPECCSKFTAIGCGDVDADLWNRMASTVKSAETKMGTYVPYGANNLPTIISEPGE
jgi:Fe-S-cluster containining protein